MSIFSGHLSRGSWVTQNCMLFVAFSFSMLCKCAGDCFHRQRQCTGLVSQPTCFSTHSVSYQPLRLHQPAYQMQCTNLCTRASVPEAVHQRGSIPSSVPESQCTNYLLRSFASLQGSWYWDTTHTSLHNWETQTLLNTAFIFTDTISGWIQE